MSKYRRPYPSSGSESSRPHTMTARCASVEARKTPVEVWVRCCNKMHPVRITKSGRVSVPAHKNLKAERMMIRMGAKEPRCLQILRLWKGDLPKVNPVNGWLDRDERFNQKLQKHLPEELQKAYCGGLKYRDSQHRDANRYNFKTPVLGEELSWFPSSDEKDFWFTDILPQMAMERLLTRELYKTPKVVQALRGRKLTIRTLDFKPKELVENSEHYYGTVVTLGIRKAYWYRDEGKVLNLCGTLDKSFIRLATSGQNRLKNGDLILGMYHKGSRRYLDRQERIKVGNKGWQGPGAPYVERGEKDIYVALTIYHNDIKDIEDIVESEEGIITDEGEWLCLKSIT